MNHESRIPEDSFSTYYNGNYNVRRYCFIITAAAYAAYAALTEHDAVHNAVAGRAS